MCLQVLVPGTALKQDAAAYMQLYAPTTMEGTGEDKPKNESGYRR